MYGRRCGRLIRSFSSQTRSAIHLPSIRSPDCQQPQSVLELSDRITDGGADGVRLDGRIRSNDCRAVVEIVVDWTAERVPVAAATAFIANWDSECKAFAAAPIPLNG